MTEESYTKLAEELGYSALRVQKNQAALARMKEFVDTEPMAAARYDAQMFWKPKILKAIQKGKCTMVTNKGWLGGGRGDKEYIEALQQVLGNPFNVFQGDALSRGPWTEVGWWR